jgi:hypothetical protein
VEVPGTSPVSVGARTAIPVSINPNWRHTMKFAKSLALSLATLVPLALIPGCSDNVSSKGQLISCTTTADGNLKCAPNDSADETPAPGTCTDVDEDGDGEAHDDDGDDHDDDGTENCDDRDDDNDGSVDSQDDDDDNDGIPDEDDCDEHDGQDDDNDGEHDGDTDDDNDDDGDDDHGGERGGHGSGDGSGSGHT